MAQVQNVFILMITPILAHGLDWPDLFKSISLIVLGSKLKIE